MILKIYNNYEKYTLYAFREPYSVVQYLAERVDLPKVLRLEPKSSWTAYDLCEAWAIQRGDW